MSDYERPYPSFPSGYDEWKTTDPRQFEPDDYDPDDFDDRDYEPADGEYGQ